ncbi:MAG: homoserine dehydrogenase [Candidatus Margulisiibacteriota bacterium]
MIHIAVLGMGTVATGLVQILQRNAALIRDRIGEEVGIKWVLVRDPQKPRTADLTGVKLTTDMSGILTDPDVHIVVELMGGEEPAKTYISQALAAGKHVVTANKEVLSKHKTHFFDLALHHGVSLHYEASVGGSIPIVQALKLGYAANHVTALYGILNGTTNYILTRMEQEKMDYQDALKLAQQKGFAEADPHMDVSGQDAAYKLDILARIAFQADIRLADLHFEGIENISARDFVAAADMGYRIKLVATGQVVAPDRLALGVFPMMIPQGHPLAAVSDEYNAVFLNTDCAGEAMLYGRGAGGLPTGSAVAADIMDVVLHQLQNSKDQLVAPPSAWNLVPLAETQSQFYIRLLVEDTAGVLEKITGICGRDQISISKILQKNVIDSRAEIELVTHRVPQRQMQDALHQFQTLPTVHQISQVLRVGLA